MNIGKNSCQEPMKGCMISYENVSFINLSICRLFYQSNFGIISFRIYRKIHAANLLLPRDGANKEALLLSS